MCMDKHFRVRNTKKKKNRVSDEIYTSKSQHLTHNIYVLCNSITYAYTTTLIYQLVHKEFQQAGYYITSYYIIVVIITDIIIYIYSVKLLLLRYVNRLYFT